MIELLGVGVPRRDGTGWLLHRVCTQFQAGELTIAVSRDAVERSALLDAVAGRRLPEEGRVYLGRVPITRESAGKLRGRVGDTDLTLRLEASHSVFWNTLAGRRPGLGTLLGLLRFPRRAERQGALAALERVGLRDRARHPAAELSAEDRVRLVIARELARRPEYLVVREVDAGLSSEDAARVLAMLGGLARTERLGILASVESWNLARARAHRVVALVAGLLVFDGRAAALTRELIARRLGSEVAERA